MLKLVGCFCGEKCTAFAVVERQTYEMAGSRQAAPVGKNLARFALGVAIGGACSTPHA